MPSIIKSLVAEHREFCALFDGMVAALPRMALEEIQRFTRLLEKLLLSHAAAEDDLVLLALREGPENKRRYERFYNDHHEIGGQLIQIYGVEQIARGQHLLKIVMAHSRRHFAHEERLVFPLLEQVIKAEALDKLGAMWTLQRHSIQDITQALMKEFNLAQPQPTIPPERDKTDPAQLFHSANFSWMLPRFAQPSH